jgi:hypothetical protein
VRTVHGAAWQEDIGLAAEAILQAENGPAWCSTTCGLSKASACCSTCSPQAAQHTFGFPEHLTKWELSDAYRQAYLQDQKIIPPRSSRTARCSRTS